VPGGAASDKPDPFNVNHSAVADRVITLMKMQVQNGRRPYGIVFCMTKLVSDARAVELRRVTLSGVAGLDMHAPVDVHHGDDTAERL
jgi:hypothetical protein